VLGAVRAWRVRVHKRLTSCECVVPPLRLAPFHTAWHQDTCKGRTDPGFRGRSKQAQRRLRSRCMRWYLLDDHQSERLSTAPAPLSLLCARPSTTCCSRSKNNYCAEM